MLPMYKIIAHENILSRSGKNFNAGLIFAKFFDRWDDSKRWSFQKNSKQEWLKKFISAYKAMDNDLISQQLEEYSYRLKRLVNALGGTVMLYKTKWRFVAGLGLKNPTEIGFSWHHTLGVPYLPGSSFKGLVRSWVENFQKRDPEEIKRIFGSMDKQKSDMVGSVIFFDVLPSRKVELELDVMTPHYSPYYMQKDDRSEDPGDWFDPVPIHFLTVAHDQPFVFCVAPRTKEHVQDMEKVKGWIHEALTQKGAGAKTNVGYGRFEQITEA